MVVMRVVGDTLRNDKAGNPDAGKKSYQDRGQQCHSGLFEHATQAGESLVKINETVDGMLAMNRNIAASTESQGETAEQVNDNMASIKSLSEQTSASANAIASTSKQVNDLAGQLQQLLAHFKV